ncbi:hypothetical protein JT359_00280 [Candidatus Poribacteria bacterium]|nr:hypothetical protein [Candidatus Poribacteria bacterium]
MNNAEIKSKQLVDPDEYPLNINKDTLDIKEHLQDAGFSADDSNWLFDVFKMPDCFGDPSTDSKFRANFTGSFILFFPKIREKLDAETIEIVKQRQTRLALLFSCMTGLGIIGGFPTCFQATEGTDRPDNVQWIKKFLKHSNFQVQELDLEILYKETLLDNLLLYLFPDDIAYDELVDLERLNPKPRHSRSTNDIIDFSQLDFWLRWRFTDNVNRSEKIRLERLLPAFSDYSNDVLGEKTLGLMNVLSDLLGYGPSSLVVGELIDQYGGWKTVASELLPFIKLLDSRNPESIEKPSSLLKAWWHLSHHTFSWSVGGLESELSEDLRNRLIESASRHIGILGSILRDTPEKFEDNSNYEFYNMAFYVLLFFDRPWKRIKTLLLVFTKMTKQSVASDLRTWKELDSKDNPPPIYSRVSNWIEVAMYPHNLKNEIERDPYLQELREEFGKFCLGRLRTKERNDTKEYNNEDFVEPRPAWRQCYVQALKALRVNPGGRGHKALFWLLNNDPDETVREKAKNAHRQVRHLDRDKPNLDKGASPRRPLFEAFWWLRQAHLLTLGIPIDADGAMRTRRTELHRTREKDDRKKYDSLVSIFGLDDDDDFDD